MMVPVGGPQEDPDLQGKYRRFWGSVPFGGSDGLDYLSFHVTQVLPQRGHGFRPVGPGTRIDDGGDLPTDATVTPGR